MGSKHQPYRLYSDNFTPSKVHSNPICPKATQYCPFVCAYNDISHPAAAGPNPKAIVAWECWSGVTHGSPSTDKVQDLTILCQNVIVTQPGVIILVCWSKDMILKYQYYVCVNAPKNCKWPSWCYILVHNNVAIK
jgi:hypothetical protein